MESDVLDASVIHLTPEVQTEVWRMAAGFREWLTRATKTLRNSMSFFSSLKQRLFRQSQFTLGVLRSCHGCHVRPLILPLPAAQLSTGRRPGQQVLSVTWNRTRNVKQEQGQKEKACAKSRVLERMAGMWCSRWTNSFCRKAELRIPARTFGPGKQNACYPKWHSSACCSHRDLSMAGFNLLIHSCFTAFLVSR